MLAASMAVMGEIVMASASLEVSPGCISKIIYTSPLSRRYWLKISTCAIKIAN
jgi:hypothetical protein